MAGLGATTLDLARMRGNWRTMMEAAKEARETGFKAARESSFAGPADASTETPLTRVTGFGSNPGNLDMFCYAPSGLPDSPALVVVLHGCTQDAVGYDAGAGWSTLAERYGFVLVCPQQTAANNPKTCFNWFQPADTTRDGGEALSIRQMVEHAAVTHRVDRRRIFVTGLSAGGAMTAVMLATYPEVFSAGAIVAGLPYGAAANVQQALQAMFETRGRPAGEWGDHVRSASTHRGAWPRLSVWHGGTDAVVKPINAVEIVKQWTNLHGLPAEPSARDTVDGHPREVWRDAAGQEVIESFTIAAMGHGTPLRAGEAEGMCGIPGPFLLEVGISSSYHIAKFWGLTTGPARQARTPSSAVTVASGQIAYVAPDGAVAMSGRPKSAPSRAAFPKAPLFAPAANDIGAVITDALRAAGLVRR